MAKYRQYKFSKCGHTYILIAAKPKTSATTEKTPLIHMNHCVSLCLVCTIPSNNTKHPVPEALTPLLQETPTKLYVPRNEASKEIKKSTFSAGTLKALFHNLVPSLIAEFSNPNYEFGCFFDIDRMYREGKILKVEPLQQHQQSLHAFPQQISRLQQQPLHQL